MNVVTNTTTGELCLQSIPEDCFATTVYSITVYDITGCSIHTQAGINNGVCTEIEVLRNPDSVCAPFEIAIDAHNTRISYQKVSHTMGEGRF